VTYEAEAPGNELGGTAWIDDYPGASGGQIVRNIGVWKGPQRLGFLRFTGVTVPATGTYVMTFFYVHMDGATERSAEITVGGGAPFTVTVDGSDVCCAASSVRITLQRGTNTVTFGNPNGHAPSIDKIVIAAA
jgi:alpha-galactosidase